jgi:heptosyltransferase-2
MPELSTTPEERLRGVELGEGCTVGMQPGARWPGKQIPQTVAIEVIRELVAGGEKVALLGGAEEAEAAEAIAREFGDSVVTLAGKTGLRETLGVLTTLRCVIGADTGLMHLAAGVGRPTVTIFGPTSRDKWGHSYAPHRVLSAPGGLMANVDASMILRALGEVLRAA